MKFAIGDIVTWVRSHGGLNAGVVTGTRETRTTDVAREYYELNDELWIDGGLLTLAGKEDAPAPILSVLLSTIAPRCWCCSRPATVSDSRYGNGDPATWYACDEHPKEGKAVDLPAAKAIREAERMVGG